MTQYVESTMKEGELVMRKPNAIRTLGVLAIALVPLWWRELATGRAGA